MDALAAEFIERLRDQVLRSSSLGRLVDWLERGTRLNGRPFSLQGHEYQRAIINSTHPHVTVRKPSQVGMSEAMSRLFLGFLATQSDVVGLFLMPTAMEAVRFAKARIDPVIRSSPALRSMLVPGSDSSSFKEIGDSQMFVGGTFGKAVISVPTDLLMIDELDFCNPENVVTAESRLSHSRFVDPVTESRGFRRMFSTPTVEGYGVTSQFEQSCKFYRLVKCPSCNHWFWPDWLSNCVVDGFDRPFSEMTHLDAESLILSGKDETARLLCPACRNTVSRQALVENREWVAEFPDRRTIEGYQVSPFDLPDYHSPRSLIRSRLRYKDEVGHFRNFSLGLPYTDASNSILDGTVEVNTVLAPVEPGVSPAPGPGVVAGMDVGKRSWFGAGKQVDGKLHLLWCQSVALRDVQSGSDLVQVALELLVALRVQILVIDALPYTDSVLALQEKAAEEGIRVIPCQYTLTDKALQRYRLVEKDNSVSANRTKTLNHVASRVNRGDVLFPMVPEMKTVRKHLQALKRVDREGEDGVSSTWVRSGDDHYFQVLNYLMLAAEIWGEEYVGGGALDMGVSQAWLGKNVARKTASLL